MLNKLVEIISGLEERVFIDENDMITEKEINEFGFITIRNNFIIAVNDLAIAAMVMMQFENIDNYVPMILVDDNFMDLSDNCKKFIIAHELGHYNYHVHKITNYDYVRDINDEFEADRYASEQVGLQNAISALEELQETLIKLTDDEENAGVIEIETRIEQLLNKTIVSC